MVWWAPCTTRAMNSPGCGWEPLDNAVGRFSTSDRGASEVGNWVDSVRVAMMILCSKIKGNERTDAEGAVAATGPVQGGRQSVCRRTWPRATAGPWVPEEPASQPLRGG